MSTGHHAPGCVFCEVGAGTRPARVVAATADTLTFLPLDPVHPGHVLVVPRRHVVDIWDLDEATAAAVGTAVLRAAHAVRAVHRPEGLNVIQSSGAVATQSVFHLHVHVVPRYTGDRMPRLWPEAAETDADRLDDSARRLRAALAIPRNPALRHASLQHESLQHE